jgi:hypothetical protein
MDPKFLRFLKEPKKKSKKESGSDGTIPWGKDELWEEKEKPMETEAHTEPKNLFELFRAESTREWFGQNHAGAKAAYNLMNKTLHPDRPLARGVAILAAKGTSFEDKRMNCLKVAANIEAGEGTGEILLRAEPNNAYDPNAVAIQCAQTGVMLGYIPKAEGVNTTYASALKDEKFTGGYIVEIKHSKLKGEDNVMLLIATGWL